MTETRTSDANPTGVRDYDHTRLAVLPEYRDLQAAVDGLATALRRRDDIPVDQERFLAAVTDAAAAVGYADSCERCRAVTSGLEPHYPYRVAVDGDWVEGCYRCPVGHEWGCGYSIGAPALFGGMG